MKTILYTFFFVLLMCGNAFATQQHADPEGLYSHQIAHIFFILSMAVLVYQIRKSNQTQKGWKFIELAAILFILWNLDTFTVHIIRESIPNEVFSTPSGIWSRTVDLSTFKTKVFYVGKIFDHFLLVGSVFVFLKGIIAFQRDGATKETPSP